MSNMNNQAQHQFTQSEICQTKRNRVLLLRLFGRLGSVFCFLFVFLSSVQVVDGVLLFVNRKEI